MPTPDFSKPQYAEKLKQALTAMQAANGNQTKAAKMLGISRTTFQSRYDAARTLDMKATGKDETDLLRAEVRNLRARLAQREEQHLNAEWVKRKIFGLVDSPPMPPKWVIEPKRKSGNGPGVPTLFCSDWHWGERVDPAQIGGVNKFDLKIAHERAELLTFTSIDLLTNHIVNPSFPGIVLILGGDMVSGDIHEELSETNEKPIMAVVVDIVGVLIKMVETLAEKFGRVFVVAVTGNHGRNTKKMRHKDRVYTSFDWLIYQWLQKHFQDYTGVSFLVPDGPDAYFRIFNHRYLLTHGDQYRGGDGQVGAIGPIKRGDHKKRSRNAEIAQPYDTQVMGHWHQLIQTRRIIVNGSLKGYCEYAFANNFEYEPAQQALWLTHHNYGITISMPVLCDRKPKVKETAWASIPV